MILSDTFKRKDTITQRILVKSNKKLCHCAFALNIIAKN